MILKGKVTERKQEIGERDFSIRWFSPEMTTAARAQLI